jgi:hypothetical protein
VKKLSEKKAISKMTWAAIVVIIVIIAGLAAYWWYTTQSARAMGLVLRLSLPNCSSQY